MYTNKGLWENWILLLLILLMQNLSEPLMPSHML